MESWIITVYTPSCIAIFILLDDNWTKWNQLKGYFPSCYILWQLAFAHMFITAEWDAEAECGLTEQITWSWHFISKWLKEIWNCVVINCDQILAKSHCWVTDLALWNKLHCYIGRALTACCLWDSVLHWSDDMSLPVEWMPVFDTDFHLGKERED